MHLTNETSRAEDIELGAVFLWLWTSVAVIEWLVGFVVNSTLILSYFKHENRATIATILTANLAVSDLALIGLGVPVAVVTAFRHPAMPTTVGNLAEGCVLLLPWTTSLMTVSAISYDRRLSVHRPFRLPLSRKRRGARIVVIWCSAACLSAMGIAANRSLYPMLNKQSVVSLVNVVSLPMFVLLLSFMAYNYITMRRGMGQVAQMPSIMLQGAAFIADAMPGHRSQFSAVILGQIKRRRRKIFKITCIVLLTTLTFWTPYVLVTFYEINAVREPTIASLRLRYCLLTFGLANHAAHPFLYAGKSTQWRRALNKSIPNRLQAARITHHA